MQRRTFLLTSLLPGLLASAAEATEIDPKQTFRPAARRHHIRPLGSVAARQRRDGEALWGYRQAGPLPCPDEMEPGLVQRAAQLCHRSYPDGHVGHVVGQQRRRLHAGYGGGGAGRRLCQANRTPW
jgi:hypothetical protein